MGGRLCAVLLQVRVAVVRPALRTFVVRYPLNVREQFFRARGSDGVMAEMTNFFDTSVFVDHDVSFLLLRSVCHVESFVSVENR